MDLYCPVCGEPWEFDSLHDRANELGAPQFSELPAEVRHYAGQEYGTARNDNHRAYQKYRADYDRVFKSVQAEFRRVGCEALGEKHSRVSTETDSSFGLTRQEAAAAMYELLGDDMDGAAAMMDDMGW